MARAYIGLGANLGDPPRQVRDALSRMAQVPGLELVACSSLYRSEALGPGPQADYCNAACAVETVLAPERLLHALHAVEREMGRERPPQRWAPRLIDLDLLHYEGVQVRGESLSLPHPELARRNFVLVPLAEIAPALEIPGLGRAEALAAAAGRDGLALWPAA